MARALEIVPLPAERDLIHPAAEPVKRYCEFHVIRGNWFTFFEEIVTFFIAILIPVLLAPLYSPIVKKMAAASPNHPSSRRIHCINLCTKPNPPV